MLEVIREGQGKVSTFLARGDQVGNGEERTLFVVLRTTKTTLPVLSPHALRACGDTGGYDRCGTLRYLGVVIRTNLPEYGGGFSTEGRDCLGLSMPIHNYELGRSIIGGACSCYGPLVDIEPGATAKRGAEADSWSQGRSSTVIRPGDRAREDIT
jgi:hypothetical protein